MFAALTALSLVVATGDPPKLSEAAEKELKKFEGKWKLVKEITSNGEREYGDDSEMVIEFKGRKILLDIKEKLELEVSALDPSTDPKIIDLKSLVEKGPIPKGTVIEAIYKFDGDTLTLAGHAGEAKKRPANFDAPKEEMAGIWVLKRIKK